MDQGGSA
ncbi:unnamed protein product [Linum tenue]|nr:unnamed protein product [Linum tenue]